MKKQKVISLLLCLTMALTACAAASTEQTQTVIPETISAASSPAETVSAVQTSEKTAETTESSVFTNRDLDASYIRNHGHGTYSDGDPRQRTGEHQ